MHYKDNIPSITDIPSISLRIILYMVYKSIVLRIVISISIEIILSSISNLKYYQIRNKNDFNKYNKNKKVTLITIYNYQNFM